LLMVFTVAAIFILDRIFGLDRLIGQGIFKS